MSSVGSLKLNPSAPDTYITSPITGTGSRVSTLYSGQQSGPASIEDNPLFTGLVPEGLLRECDKASGVKCFVCLVTLVKSSKDRQRSGVKLRCPCNVRVCTTCFKNNPEWYLIKPHFTKCQTVQEFVCSVCACFQGVREKVCCVWMCPGCSSERRRPASFCPECSGSLDQWARCESRALCCKLNGSPEDPGTGAVAAHEDKRIGQYRDLIRSRVFDKVSRSRHLSSADIRTLFPECFAPQVCTCKSESDRNPMCASCTHVLTVMQLLARNPCPLLASFAERAIPGRALARNLYDRALLSSMLNDRDLPFCANGRSCKGMLVNVQNNPRLLPSLISPESYNRFVSSRAKTGEVLRIDPCCCILCLLFNQSAAVAQMVSSEGLHLEPHPSGPVYYFNVKLSSDLGVPEVSMDQYQDYLVNFQGSVGSYKPTFYYNWRDAIDVLHRDNLGNITMLPLK
ncbi:hypothetical protein DPEC_G00376830 [Dallia pectoralis]|nr:hypothetical protein DPEC_G00376830 [Dallia pectoralis]